MVYIIRSSLLTKRMLIMLLLISTPALGGASDIKLVLQITIDGLRPDLIQRSLENFSKNGFNYFFTEGYAYNNAHYLHANTETIVGHTTLATGTTPAVHGMTGNVWFDHHAKELVYNIEDPNAPLLPTRDLARQGEQVDPAQKLARSKGRSPEAILVPTFSDTLSAYYGGQSKVFAVSGKDRSAVAMAGHIGKAFWFSTNTGDFVSSQYYYDDYPEWVKGWNQQRNSENYAGKNWSLVDAADSYKLINRDDRPYEVDLKGFSRTFPHPYGPAEHPLFNTRVLVSPLGDQLTLDFSKALIEGEGLGRDTTPDYLSISFSGVDAVNHFFGPNSLENEDSVRQLDRTLSDLLKFIDKKVGLKNTVIVLSADHGMADMPEYISEQGYKVGRLYSEQVVALANQAGEELFGIKDVSRFFFRPYLYLNDETLAKAKLDKATVEQAIATKLTEHEGIAMAVPQSGLSPLQDTVIYQQIKNNNHPLRSGDIYVAQAPYWFMFEKGPVAAMHGSPWRYDTHVPIIFAGAGIKSGSSSRLVHPSDVAPTLAGLLNISPPAASQGNVLSEVIEGK
ncbi:alkaline phosphatase family protein [Photobacterium sagamiensis]|uniref:alkaline phosphatase family protein n=1 Tax=Photobacterium sagamiensis TaxID=2910241 RepID=UPI003D0E7E8B